jgi:hypothetical protein
MKPCKIRLFRYTVPRGDIDDPWRFWDQHDRPSDEPHHGLLCDSEEHADRILAALRDIERNETKA